MAVHLVCAAEMAGLYDRRDSYAIVTIYERVTHKAVSLRAFFIGAVAFLLVAFFLAWRDQRQQYLALKEKTESTRLIGEIYTFFSGTRPETGDTEMFIQMAIKNTGSPTIVQGYQLHITGNGLDLNGVSPTMIPTTLTLH